MGDSSYFSGARSSSGGNSNAPTRGRSNKGQEDGGSENFAPGNSGPSCETPPHFRVWETVSKTTFCNSNTDSFKFKVVSYNVLAQYLLEIQPYYYSTCSPINLTWEVRAAHIFDEIVHLAPDILCLQEVQASHMSSFYSKFEDLGYRGVYKRMTGNGYEGCAIYYRRSLFELLEYVNVEFFQPELQVLDRDNIGVIVKLLPRRTPTRPIVVASTYLAYGHKLAKVRLAQIRVFLAEIDRFAYYSNPRRSGYLPIILTGDLNSNPRTPLIEFLDTGSLRVSHHPELFDWQRIGVTDHCQHFAVYRNRIEGKKTEFKDLKIRNTEFSRMPRAFPPTPDDQDFSELYNSGEIGHSLQLRSVYKKYKQNGMKEATTFYLNWVTFDYMYFRCCSNMYLRERLRLPSVQECTAMGRIPNDVYGSDHFALGAVFELLTPKFRTTSGAGPSNAKP